MMGTLTNQGLLLWAMLVAFTLLLVYRFPAVVATALLLLALGALVAGTLVGELWVRRPKTGGSRYSS